MALIERTAYPCFTSSFSSSDLARLYTPTFREIELATQSTRGQVQQLAFLVMLKSFQRLGYFPASEKVPEVIVSQIGSRLGAKMPSQASPSLRSRQRYRGAIRDYLQVKAYGHEARRASMEAVADAAASMDDPADWA